MKIHSLCIAKDEADIIEQTLQAASRWSDYIYVYDNGSQDGTWEKVIALSHQLKQIIPYKQDDRPFNNGLRGEIFNHFRNNSASGDWWCRLDADEIYIDNPHDFLSKITQPQASVWSASFQYYLTDKDVTQFEQNPDHYADDVAVEQKCRYYINNWSEIRFFRDHPTITWEADERWPAAVIADKAHPVRIRLKHYQYRSPQQIQRRIDIRKAARAKGSPSFLHEVQSNWQANTLQGTQPVTEASKASVTPEAQPDAQSVASYPVTSNSDLGSQTHSLPEWQARIMPAAQLEYDTHDGHYTIRKDLLPTLNPINERLRAKAKLMVRACKQLLVFKSPPNPASKPHSPAQYKDSAYE